MAAGLSMVGGCGWGTGNRSGREASCFVDGGGGVGESGSTLAGGGTDWLFL